MPSRFGLTQLKLWLHTAAASVELGFCMIAFFFFLTDSVLADVNSLSSVSQIYATCLCNEKPLTCISSVFAMDMSVFGHSNVCMCLQL